MEVDRRSSTLLVLDGALDDELVASLLAPLDVLRFEEQEQGRGQLRARTRAEADDQSLADRLWHAIDTRLSPPVDWYNDANPPPALDPSIDRWTWRGCNPRLRWYRYELGAEFPRHLDEPWRPDTRTRSLLTLLVFLPTSGCVGGETVVDGEVVAAVDGRVVIFGHDQPHAGRPVEGGTKLVLRTDVVACAD